MVIHRGEIDPGEQSDIAERHTVKTAGGINTFGRAEDAFAGGLDRFFGHTTV